MNYKILEANGVENENVDGAALNNTLAGGANGIFKKYLNECRVYSTGGKISVNTGAMMIQGFRIKITDPWDHSIESVPATEVTYQIVARLELKSTRDVSFEIICRTPEDVRQDNLFLTESGVYEVEIATFVHSVSGEIKEISKTMPYLIPIGTGGGGGVGDPGKSAYEIWLDLGNNGSPQDFLSSLRFKYSDFTATQLAALKGRGITKTSVAANGNLTITYTDGKSENAGKVVGSNGRGITKTSVAANGNLTITYTDGKSENAGKVVGSNGRGISNIRYSQTSNALIFEFTDSTSQTITLPNISGGGSAPTPTPTSGVYAGVGGATLTTDMMSNSHYFTRMDLVTGTHEYKFTTPEDGYVYLCIPSTNSMTLCKEGNTQLFPNGSLEEKNTIELNSVTYKVYRLSGIQGASSFTWNITIN